MLDIIAIWLCLIVLRRVFKEQTRRVCSDCAQEDMLFGDVEGVYIGTALTACTRNTLCSSKCWKGSTERFAVFVPGGPDFYRAFLFDDK
jgi:hypothetical protein